MQQLDKKTLVSAHLALAGVALLYGINYFTVKPALQQIDSSAATVIRCVVTTLIFMAIHALTVGEKVKSGKDYLHLLACGMFGVSINQLLFLEGVHRTSEVNSAVLMITAPLFVFIMALALKREKATVIKFIGIALAFVGAYFLITGSAKSADSRSDLIGDLMITINAASYGAYLITVTPILKRYHVMTVIKWVFIFGTLSNVLFTLLKSGFSDVTSDKQTLMTLQPALWELKTWVGMAFLIAGATVGTYLLNAYAMSKLNSVTVGMYVFSQPVFVSVVSLFVIENSFTPMKVLYILLIFAGVFLVTLYHQLSGSIKS